MEKFKDVNALLKAYNCLEAEFTKRSQRLKQLEGEVENLKIIAETKPNDSLADQAKTVGEAIDEVMEKHPSAQKYRDEIIAVADDNGGSAEGVVIDFLLNELNKLAETFGKTQDSSQIDSAIKDEIIREFLSGIVNAKPSEKALGGEIVLTPPIKPKNLQEAKVLAQKFFK